MRKHGENYPCSFQRRMSASRWPLDKLGEYPTFGKEHLVANDYDHQLIESVAVRRTRLTTALVYGANPFERRWKSSARTFMASILVAALIATICVGFSFVSNLLETLRAQQQQRSSAAPIELVWHHEPPVERVDERPRAPLSEGGA